MSEFEAVTPNGKETEISKVKVRWIEDISPEELAIIKKYQPNFQPKSEMYRLEQIDEEIGRLQKAVDDAQTTLNEKIALRKKVEEAALMVKLATIELIQEALASK
jgi:hypothetical protein